MASTIIIRECEQIVIKLKGQEELIYNLRDIHYNHDIFKIIAPVNTEAAQHSYLIGKYQKN